MSKDFSISIMVRLIKQRVRPHKNSRIKNISLRLTQKTIFKFVFITLVITGFGAGFQIVKYLIVDSDYFYIKQVDVKFYNYDKSVSSSTIEAITDYNLIGEYIFFVNIDELKENIKRHHPDFKDVEIRRVLPDRLIVEIKRRKPIAQISLDRFYLVDDEGFILPDARNIPQDGLPVISGMKSFHPKKETIEMLVDLIKCISSHKYLSGYKLKNIDASDHHNISFFLDKGNVEIKIGESDFEKRLDLLATILEQLRSDIDRIKYIDLRFEEPVLGPR